MDKNQEKPGSPYTHINLTICARFLLGLHSFPILTLFIDVCLMDCMDSSPTSQNPTDIISYLLTYASDSDIKAALLSALLVIWTFITAVVIFYMEKRDNTYCGVRTWDIISFDIGKKQKRIIAFAFFFELLLILAAFLFNFPWTLICLLLLYPLTAGCTFGFVSWATAEQTIKKRYYDMILHEYDERRGSYPATSMERIPSLATYLNSLPFFTERDWDNLLELLVKIFVSLCSGNEVYKQSDAQRTLYTIVGYILNNTSDTDHKVRFLKNMSIKTYEKVKGSPEAADILSSVSFPAIAFHDNTGFCYYTNCFSVISDKALGHEMLLRGIVFSIFLHFTTRSGHCASYSKKLLQVLKQTGGHIRGDDWKQMHSFTLKLQNKFDSQFNMQIVDQYIHK